MVFIHILNEKYQKHLVFRNNSINMLTMQMLVNIQEMHKTMHVTIYEQH